MPKKADRRKGGCVILIVTWGRGSKIRVILHTSSKYGPKEREREGRKSGERSIEVRSSVGRVAEAEGVICSLRLTDRLGCRQEAREERRRKGEHHWALGERPRGNNVCVPTKPVNSNLG